MKIKRVPICVIGAANTDLIGFPNDRLIFNDSNKGQIRMLPGGVGRNVAENLSRLHLDVSLISIFGNDYFYDFIRKHSEKLHIDLSDSIVLEGQSSAVFSAILNRGNDLAVAIADMHIYDNIKPDQFMRDFPSLEKAEVVVMETNFPSSVLDYLVNRFPDKKWIADTVSGDKAKRIEAVYDRLAVLKTNLIEAEILTGMSARTTDYRDMVQFFLDEGVENVFLTLDKEGVIYGNKQKIAYQPPVPGRVLNTIGAGDAFLSGVVFGFVNQFDLDKMATMGLRAAGLTVQSERVVSEEISPEKLLQDQ